MLLCCSVRGHRAVFSVTLTKHPLAEALLWDGKLLGQVQFTGYQLLFS